MGRRVVIPARGVTFERLRASAAGNPRWRIIPATGPAFRTAVNTSLAWELPTLPSSCKGAAFLVLLVDGRGGVYDIVPADAGDIPAVPQYVPTDDDIGADVHFDGIRVRFGGRS